MKFFEKVEANSSEEVIEALKSLGYTPTVIDTPLKSQSKWIKDGKDCYVIKAKPIPDEPGKYWVHLSHHSQPTTFRIYRSSEFNKPQNY